MAFVSRTRATLRSAEFGFFGVCVYTRMHTPRFSGQPASAGDFVFIRTASRPILTSCENVGTVFPQLERMGREAVRMKTKSHRFTAHSYELRKRRHSLPSFARAIFRGSRNARK